AQAGRRHVGARGGAAGAGEPGSPLEPSAVSTIAPARGSMRASVRPRDGNVIFIFTPPQVWRGRLIVARGAVAVKDGGCHTIEKRLPSACARRVDAGRLP